MPPYHLGADAFGDRFALNALPLPRPAGGYAVQMLGSDLLLDRHSGELLPVRSAALAALFDSFDDAYAAAECWVETHCSASDDHRLAIVPGAFDDILERHVLIYGVLQDHP